MPENDNDAMMLTRASVRKLQEAVRRLESIFAVFSQRGSRSPTFDIIPAVWVQTSGSIAPGASGTCTIYRQGSSSSDTITVYNRYVNTTVASGTRWIAMWIDGEWAFAPGECAA